MIEPVKYDMIESMRACGIVKYVIERRLAELALGVIGALKEKSIAPADAYHDLFNLDMYQAIKKHRLSAEMKELFQWGMELEDVAEIAPKGLDTSYNAIEKLARGILSNTSVVKMDRNRYPKGWNEKRVRRVILAHDPR